MPNSIKVALTIGHWDLIFGISAHVNLATMISLNDRQAIASQRAFAKC